MNIKSDETCCMFESDSLPDEKLNGLRKPVKLNN